MPPSQLRPPYLDVSRLAAAAGRNRWNPQEQVLADCFRKDFPSEVSRLQGELSSTPLVLAREAVEAVAASERCEEATAEERTAKRARLVEELASSALEGLHPTMQAKINAVQRARQEAVETVAALKEDALLKTAALAEKEMAAQRASLDLHDLEELAANRLCEATALEASASGKSHAELLILQQEVEEKLHEAAAAQRKALEVGQANENALRAKDDAQADLHVATAKLRAAEGEEKAAASREATITTLANAAPGFVRREVRSAVETRRGVRDEAAAIAAVPGFEPASRAMVYGNYSCGGYTFRLGGRCDGKQTASGDLLEVKNRQREYKGLPVYEEIQVLAYLLIHDRHRCVFREVLAGVAAEDRVVLRDDARLRGLVDEGLLKFMCKWERMRTDKAYCTDVLLRHPPRL
jgi:hypothetical protein